MRGVALLLGIAFLPGIAALALRQGKSNVGFLTKPGAKEAKLGGPASQVLREALNAQPSPLREHLIATLTAVHSSKTRLHGDGGDEGPPEEDGGGDGKMSCGALKKYENAKPKNYADAKKTKYDKELKKHVDVTFSAGDTIDFECDMGYTTDGAKGGPTEFVVTCEDLGYFTTDSVCVKESKCGGLPQIKNAVPTGKTTPDKKGEKVQYTCNDGYSLDGEKRVPGRTSQWLFEVQCSSWSGEYEGFEGKCQPFAFKPTGEVLGLYNEVFEVLFKVDCKGQLTVAKKKHDEPPPGLDDLCSKLEDKAGDCGNLVGEIKAEFGKEPEEFEAEGFCTKMWDLLSFGPNKS